MKHFICLFFLSVPPLFFAQTVTFSEDFENGIPSTWAIAIADTNTVNSQVSEYAQGWIGITEPNETNHVAAATSYFNYVAQAHRLLILPKLTMADYGNILKWSARSQDPSYPDSYQILVSTTDSLVSSFTDTVFKVIFEGEFWSTREVNLSDSGYINQDIYVAINLNSINGYKLYIDNVELRVQDPLGINELNQLQVSVFPNPASDLLKVSADLTVKQLTVLSLSGQQLARSSESTINVSQLTPGVYLLQIETDHGPVSRRFVKK